MHAHENPFRSERVEALRYRAAGRTVEAGELLAQLAAWRGRGALVGPKGSGKTTLLEELAAALRVRGTPPVVVRLSTSDRRPDWTALRQSLDSATPPPLLVDGAEQLGPLAWLRLRWCARRCPCLVVTTHRPGRLPVLHRHTTSPELLAELVDELLRTGGLPASQPTRTELDQLFDRTGGDLRQCLRALYDRVAASG